MKYDADKEESDPNAQKEVVLPGTGQVVRLCDVIADLITPEKGPLVWMSPSFRLEDPLPERDRAIADWIKVLSKNAREDTDP